jgi:hypothetical protein
MARQETTLGCRIHQGRFAVWFKPGWVLKTGFLLFSYLALPVAAHADACTNLSNLTLPGLTSIIATSEAANSIIPSVSAAPVPVPFCRVQITVRPMINIEVWLPLPAAWNHRFRALGNAGYAGSFSGAMPAALAGDPVTGQFATSSTDTGHPATGTANGDGAANGAQLGGGFALNPTDDTLNEGLITDFASRSLHEMALKAKAVIHAYYGQPPKYSYWTGCSTGGRQGWEEAQRFPEDYDGVLAGSPAINWDRLVAAQLWPQVAMNVRLGGPITQGKLSAVKAATVAACDSLDGVADGVISDPRRCHFNPHVLQCGTPGASTDPTLCLTAAEADTVEMIWQGPRDGHDRFLWFGLEPGATLAGAAQFGVLAGSSATTPPVAAPFALPLDHFRLWIEQNPAFDWRTLTIAGFARDFRASEEKFRVVLGTDNPDLSQFQGYGGKVISYHGWTDEIIMPRGTINYYQQVITSNHGLKNVQKFARLFMIPGMNHCFGGSGPTNFGQQGVTPVVLDKEHDAILALEAWVEHGAAPDRMIGSHVDASGNVTFTRPLCPYPEEAVYEGHGDTTDAANFACRVREDDRNDRDPFSLHK